MKGSGFPSIDAFRREDTKRRGNGNRQERVSDGYLDVINGGLHLLSFIGDAQKRLTSKLTGRMARLRAQFFVAERKTCGADAPLQTVRLNYG